MNDPQYMAESKKRLTKIVTAKQRTTMIGCLNRIEQLFGFLWGDERYKESASELQNNEFGLDIYKEITELEEFFRENPDLEIRFKLLWQVLRSTILNLGNNNIRDTEKEIGLYDVKWNKYTMKLPVKKMGERNG